MTTPDQDPVSIDHVVLTVHDLDKVGDYYRRVVGLHDLRRDDGTLTLGAGGRTLLELRRDVAARPHSAREAGLFHTAFLLPTRADLGRWIAKAIEERIPVQGLSDHIVSEALYLSDPEGNGIEIYVDRPRESWLWKDGQVSMATDPMDVQAVLDSGAGGVWKGAPDGTIVGHVHLQVGALAPAEAFHVGELGFDITNHYPGATFYATGGYHHHLATNIWNSRGAQPRILPSTGLSEVVLKVRDPARAALLKAKASHGVLTDPWGTIFRITAA